MKALYYFAICWSMTAFASEAPDEGFRVGRMELRMSGGINAGSGREPLAPKTPPSVGIEGAVGLNRNVAVIGEYTYNALGQYALKRPCLFCGTAGVKARIHGFLGGFRVAATNRSLVTPYGAFVVGAVRPSSSAAAEGVIPLDIAAVGLSNTGGPTLHFAFGAGGGLKFKISRDLGIDLDICAVKAMNLRWYFTPTVGFYVRFH